MVIVQAGEWSLYRSESGHCTGRRVVIVQARGVVIVQAREWSLYRLESGHCTGQRVVVVQAWRVRHNTTPVCVPGRDTGIEK